MCGRPAAVACSSAGTCSTSTTVRGMHYNRSEEEEAQLWRYAETIPLSEYLFESSETREAVGEGAQQAPFQSFSWTHYVQSEYLNFYSDRDFWVMQ